MVVPASGARVRQGFLADTVLVYLGAPNAASYAPAPRSYVDALDFAGPVELAGFLQALRADPARLRAYSAWKRSRPLRLGRGFLDAVRRDGLRAGRGSAACRLCRLARGEPDEVGGVAGG